MNTATQSSSGTGPSPDALRNYLSERSRHELDTLRSELDARLLALESALTSPDDCESLESLIVDLARVAMDEAEAATRRAIFDAQTDAQAQVESARAEARTSIDSARTTAAALHRDLDSARAANTTVQRELEESRSALKSEREAGASAQKDLQKTRTSLESERTGPQVSSPRTGAGAGRAEEGGRVQRRRAPEGDRRCGPSPGGL